ncbi:unnamed protein product [Ilex paraguariensis]|uniref:Uncharacterized protein n=1 Tax=Ilex paraguariensis TaxID=185542 RepID=A0ABC8SXJ2_9AQUA
MLESNCLVTGEGLNTLGRAVSDGLEELPLIDCDVVEREPGVLTTLGQNLRRLRELESSNNAMLGDEEFTCIMLVSCGCLNVLNLRGCNGLTNAAMVPMFENCKQLQCVDIMYCCGIGAEAHELFVLNPPMLRRVQVEQCKLSDAARMWALNNFIEVVSYVD